MRIEPPSYGLIREILENARVRDRRELMAVCGFWDPDAMASDLVHAWQYRGAWGGVFMVERPVALLTILRETPRSLQAGLVATESFASIAVSVTRYVRRVVGPQLRTAGFLRMECRCWEEHHDARRWLKLCGAKEEAEIPGYGAAGETFIQFSWS